MDLLICKPSISLLLNNVIIRVIKVQSYDFFSLVQQKNTIFFKKKILDKSYLSY